MVNLYADLVEWGVRVLENPQPGEVVVPAFLREAVRAELVARGHVQYAKVN